MKGDAAVEKGSAGLRRLSEQAAARGGLMAKLAEPLAEDADFLPKLKPSLIAERLRGGKPAAPPRHDPPEPAEKQPPNPAVAIGAGLAAGFAAARLLDWRGHAHPRD